jgi:hypothetical protein
MISVDYSDTITQTDEAHSKQFEMPLLAFTELPMSESIASACCFSQIATPLLTKRNVLNGGTVGPLTSFEVYPQVIQFFGGLATTPQVHYTYYSPTVKDPGKYSDQALWIQDGLYYEMYDVAYFTQNVNHTLGSVYIIDKGQISNKPISASGFVAPTSGICDHISRSCPFNRTVTINNAHIGSTSPHLLGGANWASPHVAAQFSS